MDLNKKNIRSILLIITFAVLLYLGVSNIGLLPGYINKFFSMIKPVILGCAIAFILNGPMQSTERLLFGPPWQHAIASKRRLSRTISLIIVFVITLGLIAGTMFLIVPELIKTLTSLAGQIPAFFTSIQDWLNQLAKESRTVRSIIASTNISADTLSAKALKLITDASGSLINQTVQVSIGIFSFLLNLIFGICLAVYILAQKEKLGRQTRSLLYSYFKEARVDRFLSITSLTSTMFSRFITGQLLGAFVLGLIYLVLMTIFHFPYALLVSLIVMIFSLLPIIGGYIAGISGTLLILIASPRLAFWFLIMYLIVQQFAGTVILPRIVGNSLGLSAMWVLIAILVGGAVWGILGMLVSIPLVSVLYALFSESIDRRLKKKKIPYFKTEQRQS